MIWTNVYAAGFLPQFLSEADERGAVAQLNAAYAHGGGWHKFEGFQLVNAPMIGEAYLQYPNDPPMREVSRTRLRDEMVILFEAEWVAVVQPSGAFEVARMD